MVQLQNGKIIVYSINLKKGCSINIYWLIKKTGKLQNTYNTIKKRKQNKLH